RDTAVGAVTAPAGMSSVTAPPKATSLAPPAPPTTPASTATARSESQAQRISIDATKVWKAPDMFLAPSKGVECRPSFDALVDDSRECVVRRSWRGRAVRARGALGGRLLDRLRGPPLRALVGDRCVALFAGRGAVALRPFDASRLVLGGAD